MKKVITLIAAALTVGSLSTPAQAGNEPWVGEITTVGFNFCPRNWLPLDGQLLPISQYNTLYSLLGTTYGGDGRVTFALPDLRGRTGVSEGGGPGLTMRRLGQRSGVETVTLNINQMPSHSHSAVSTPRGSNLPADSADPTGNVNALDTAGNTYRTADPTVDMKTGSVTTTIGSAGANQAHANMQPYLVLKYCIAAFGTYPSRN